jgi:hypothetical protein
MKVIYNVGFVAFFGMNRNDLLASSLRIAAASTETQNTQTA